MPYAQNWLAAQDMKFGELWIGASDEVMSVSTRFIVTFER